VLRSEENYQVSYGSVLGLYSLLKLQLATLTLSLLALERHSEFKLQDYFCYFQHVFDVYNKDFWGTS
jgi:hypothetical protein